MEVKPDESTNYCFQCQQLAEAYLAHCTACAENMRKVWPKFLLTLTADCVRLLPTACTVLGWEFEPG